MILFCRHKNRNRENEDLNITLQDLRRRDVNIERLMWKYKIHTTKRTNAHVCLLCKHIVELSDTDEEAAEEKNDFIEGIKRKPSKKREYVNYKTGTNLLWFNNKLIRMNSDKFDLVCFKATIKQVQKKERIIPSYWAYIYKLVTDGILGSDMHGISVDKFIEKMDGINVGARNTIYDYIPRGTYPDYHPASKDLKKYKQEEKSIQIFVNHFVEAYYRTLNQQILLEDIEHIT